jgi:endonuclease-8
MPEGDTLYRTAEVLRRALLGEHVLAARGRPGGARLARLVGSRVESVAAQGKHLLVGFDSGLTLHTHLGMKGSWHRYAHGERWRRAASSAVVVLDTERSVAVCFAAPRVELLDSRALAVHPQLSGLGPDLLADQPDVDRALSRFRDHDRPGWTIGEALLDQSCVAGIGNVYRNEVLFCTGLDPFALVGAVPDAIVRQVLVMSAALLRANLGGGDRVTMPDALGAPPGASAGLRPRRGRWVYRRAGLPCRRCRTPIRSHALGQPPRTVYWCPACQGQPSSADGADGRMV